MWQEQLPLINISVEINIQGELIQQIEHDQINKETRLARPSQNSNWTRWDQLPQRHHPRIYRKRVKSQKTS